MALKDNLFNPHENEEIVMHLRRHWFIFFKTFLILAVLSFIPLLVYSVIDQNIFPFLKNEIAYAIALVFIFTYYLFLLALFITSWTETYLDVWTITNKRIINREQNSLFHRVVAELDFSRIQDVTTEQKGFFATIFHYGDVCVQTAAEKERFVFEQVGNPYKIAKTIQKLNEEYKKNSAPKI